MGGFEDDGASCSGLLDLQPTGGADAPAVSGLEAGEAVLGHGGGEIVAQGFAGGKERRVNDAADGVDAVVFGAGLAAAGAVEAGHGGAATGVEGLAEDVFAAGFLRVGGGHGLGTFGSSIPPLLGMRAGRSISFYVLNMTNRYGVEPASQRVGELVLVGFRDRNWVGSVRSFRGM
jgi:hypothetical protein